jgi:hypothetical protein
MRLQVLPSAAPMAAQIANQKPTRTFIASPPSLSFPPPPPSGRGADRRTYSACLCRTILGRGLDHYGVRRDRGNSTRGTVARVLRQLMRRASGTAMPVVTDSLPQLANQRFACDRAVGNSTSRDSTSPKHELP